MAKSWLIVFIRRKIYDVLRGETYWKYIGELHMLETLFLIRIQGILNPDIQKLREFL